MSEENFQIIMSEHSDKKLIDILQNKNDYQELAYETAIKESIKRKLIIDKDDLQSKYPSVEKVDTEVGEVEKNIIHEKAKKDMLYGAAWCIGGLAATVADIGYIFWGAIVFGGIQFVKGLSNSK